MSNAVQSRARAAGAPPTVQLVSLGCAKNAVDLQVMCGHLVKKGFRIVSADEPADVALVNTCAFIESAREEAVDEILRACERKARGLVRAVVAAGCFVQRYAARVRGLFPLVDAFVGVDELDEIVRVARAALRRAADAPARVPVRRGPPCRVFNPPLPALRFSGPAHAFLKIAEGCAHRCAYCAIPAIRGRYRSRARRDVLREARALLASGVRELNVVAQDPLLWGVDFRRPKKTGVVDLLRALDRLPGDFWIRVLYSYPSEITDEYLDWLKRSPHAVKYVDVPLQHTDPAVLKAMGRGSAAAATRTAAARIRAAVPGATLRTTVMTGFPGETPARFRRLLADVAEMKFDHLGCFAFSPEEGTPAAAMKGRPSAAAAERRREEVMALQAKVRRPLARAKRGSVERALVVAPGVARLASQAPDVDGATLLVNAAHLAPGTFADVRIVGVRGYDFLAEPVP